MEQLLTDISTHMDAVVKEWVEMDYLHPQDLFVVGCSTSEVAGEQIGTSGSDDIAARLFTSLQTLTKEKDVHLVFQCCEHINRCLVMEKEVAKAYGLAEVSVIPHRDAGGAMATYAYNHFKNPVVVEDVEARAGVDIGETMIGMHLQKVVVPLRMKQAHVGAARITGAFTRPKLIGGARAVYEK